LARKVAPEMSNGTPASPADLLRARFGARIVNGLSVVSPVAQFVLVELITLQIRTPYVPAATLGTRNV
jgi:hypothetical protein